MLPKPPESPLPGNDQRAWPLSYDPFAGRVPVRLGTWRGGSWRSCAGARWAAISRFQNDAGRLHRIQAMRQSYFQAMPLLVRMRGLEPPRSCPRWNLKVLDGLPSRPPQLPLSHLRHQVFPLSALDSPKHQQWVPVIGRSLAYLCLTTGQLKDGSLGQKAAFLEALGIERKEVAATLGTTPASVTETLSKAKRGKKGTKKRAKATKRKRCLFPIL